MQIEPELQYLMEDQITFNLLQYLLKNPRKLNELKLSKERIRLLLDILKIIKSKRNEPNKFPLPNIPGKDAQPKMNISFKINRAQELKNSADKNYHKEVTELTFSAKQAADMNLLTNKIMGLVFTYMNNIVKDKFILDSIHSRVKSNMNPIDVKIIIKESLITLKLARIRLKYMFKKVQEAINLYEIIKNVCDRVTSIYNLNEENQRELSTIKFSKSDSKDVLKKIYNTSTEGQIIVNQMKRVVNDIQNEPVAVCAKNAGDKFWKNTLEDIHINFKHLNSQKGNQIMIYYKLIII